MVRRPPLVRSEFRLEAVQIVVVYARTGMTRWLRLRIFTTPPGSHLPGTGYPRRCERNKCARLVNGLISGGPAPSPHHQGRVVQALSHIRVIGVIDMVAC